MTAEGAIKLTRRGKEENFLFPFLLQNNMKVGDGEKRTNSQTFLKDAEIRKVGIIATKMS
jgi:hypothetical protein